MTQFVEREKKTKDERQNSGVGIKGPRMCEEEDEESEREKFHN